MNDFWSYRAPAIAWALVLFTLSSISDLPSPFHVSKWDDKLDHFVAYAILGALVLRAVAMHRPLPNARDFKITVVLGVLFGMADELHQYFVPGRFMDYKDFVADAVGVIAGAMFYAWLSERRALSRRGGIEM